MASASRRRWWSQDTSRLMRSLFRRNESTPHLPSSSYHAMDQLNDDILRHIVPYLSPETLARVNAANIVFFNAWMKSRYESLTFINSDKKMERLLVHLRDPNVACYVERVYICPWNVEPPPTNRRRLIQGLWIDINEILDAEYIEKERRRRKHAWLRHDVDLVVSAFNTMPYIKEYRIDWNEDYDYHPELYRALFIPILRKWMENLVKLTIKVPPGLLKSLASVRFIKLETLEYHICTGEMAAEDIDDIHNGFLVFVNNLKDSLTCLSFISTYTSLNLDITRIYKSLGPFPKLHSISLSVPYDGAHLSDPLVFVQFLEKHRFTLNNISLLTSRCIQRWPGEASNPEGINWIQTILTSVHSPFPRLRSLALAMRPLRAPLINVSSFLEMHIHTLDSLTLADRTLDYNEFPSLMQTVRGPFDLTGLRHLHVKLETFCPDILYYLASTMPGLINLDIECSSVNGQSINCADFEGFSKDIIDNKHLLVNWKLQRLAIGPQAQNWLRRGIFASDFIFSYRRFKLVAWSDSELCQQPYHARFCENEVLLLVSIREDRMHMKVTHTTVAMTSPPVSITTNLFYSTEPEGGVRAYQYVAGDPVTGEVRRNIGIEKKSVVIENVRGKEDSVSLDTAGFQFYKHTSKHTKFDNEEDILREYYPESIELIKKLTGASRVELFDHTIRRRRPGDNDDSPGRRQPVARVHVDQTAAATIARVHKHLPASDVPKLLERRFQIINLWRPIAHPALDWPLAFCDYRSVDLEKDSFPVARIAPDREGETLGIKYNEDHKWKYLHGMTPEEIVLIKCADSIRDGSVAISTPHTGFIDPTTPEGSPPRQSIEVRALVFYD